jgi:ABC-type dipeptide/oligopeptide/nickel transport system permease subunit
MTSVAPRVNESRRFLRVFLGRPVAAIGSVIVLVFIIAAIFPGVVAPYDPIEQDLSNTLASPSGTHLLGTDTLGRDMLSRLIFGARTAAMVGVVALSIAAISGMLLGLIAGYFGGFTSAIIMRFIDALMVFPMILLAMAIASLLGGGIKNVMIAVGIGMMPGYARVMYGQAISIKENDYVLAGRAIGANNIRIVFRHIFPNCFPVMIVLITMNIGITILAEAGLSFLGIGIEPPTPAWGAMVNEGYQYLISHPLLSFVPGLAIMFVVFAFNMVGDSLRDAIDPRLRGTI